MGPGFIGFIVIGVIVLAIFGPKNLPELGKMFGGALREFKEIKADIPSKDDLKSLAAPDDTSQEPAPKKKRPSDHNVG